MNLERFERELETARAEAAELRAENKRLRSQLEDLGLAVSRVLGCIHDGATCTCWEDCW